MYPRPQTANMQPLYVVILYTLFLSHRGEMCLQKHTYYVTYLIPPWFIPISREKSCLWTLVIGYILNFDAFKSTNLNKFSWWANIPLVYELMLLMMFMYSSRCKKNVCRISMASTSFISNISYETDFKS